MVTNMVSPREYAFATPGESLTWVTADFTLGSPTPMSPNLIRTAECDRTGPKVRGPGTFRADSDRIGSQVTPASHALRHAVVRQVPDG